MGLEVTVWVLVFIAAPSLLWPRLRAFSVGGLGAAYLLALVVGLLDWRASISLVPLIAAAYAIAPNRSRFWRAAGHVMFVSVAFLLALHVLPGFNNPLVIGPVRITPDAVPFTMYLNLDKPLAGFWLLLVWPTLCLRRDNWSPVRGVLIGLITALICLGVGVTFGKIAFAPKWPDFGWLWALNNLLLVCLTEEALFRGYLQDSLTRRFAELRRGEAFAIGIAAALFGLAHLAGGLVYALISGLAGVGYGLAYRSGGLQAAILAHFSLNLIRFSLFTYPMLAN